MQSLTYFKQTQLVCSIEIGWKCSNSHGTSLSPTFLPKIMAKWRGETVRFTWSHGHGGVGGIKVTLVPCQSLTGCWLTSAALWHDVLCPPGHWDPMQLVNCVYSFDLAMFLGSMGHFPLDNLSSSQLSLSSDFESIPCYLSSPWLRSPSPTHAM